MDGRWPIFFVPQIDDSFRLDFDPTGLDKKGEFSSWWPGILQVSWRTIVFLSHVGLVRGVEWREDRFLRLEYINWMDIYTIVAIVMHVCTHQRGELLTLSLDWKSGKLQSCTGSGWGEHCHLPEISQAFGAQVLFSVTLPETNSSPHPLKK